MTRIAMLWVRLEWMCLAAWWSAFRVALALPFWWLALKIMGRENVRDVLGGLKRKMQ